MPGEELLLLLLLLTLPALLLSILSPLGEVGLELPVELAPGEPDGGLGVEEWVMFCGGDVVE